MRRTLPRVDSRQPGAGGDPARVAAAEGGEDLKAFEEGKNEPARDFDLLVKSLNRKGIQGGRSTGTPNLRRLARELAKVDPAEEPALAEEGLATDLAAWPSY